MYDLVDRAWSAAKPMEWRVLDALNADDAAAAAGLSAGFGWPHREADWEVFLRLGHGVGWREGGRLDGTAMWFPLGEAHASIGLVQVAPALQGRGIGRRLMQAAMDAAHPRALMLHATAAGAGLYAALGFAAAGGVQQWQGEWAHPETRRDYAADRETIARLDEAGTGLSRGPMLDVLLDGAVATANATGYAVRRRWGRGQLIGPVIAAGEAAAIPLVNAIAAPGFLRIDVLAEAGALIDWLAAMGLSCAGEVLVMTTGTWPSPQGPMGRMALASQALG